MRTERQQIIWSTGIYATWNLNHGSNIDSGEKRQPCSGPRLGLLTATFFPFLWFSPQIKVWTQLPYKTIYFFPCKAIMCFLSVLQIHTTPHTCTHPQTHACTDTSCTNYFVLHSSVSHNYSCLHPWLSWSSPSSFVLPPSISPPPSPFGFLWLAVCRQPRLCSCSRLPPAMLS